MANYDEDWLQRALGGANARPWKIEKTTTRTTIPKTRIARPKIENQNENTQDATIEKRWG
eukprot:2923374-Lingulodinium_polyedra.AAC.1